MNVRELAMRGSLPVIQCPRCGYWSGDDWRQCGGVCPMPGSPYYSFGAEAHDSGDEDNRQSLVWGHPLPLEISR